jgi:hypothetical protein
MKRSKGHKRSPRGVWLQACDGGQDWLLRPRREPNPPKKRVTINLDADVLAWFKEKGRWYQKDINWALRKVMVEEKELGNRAPSTT